MHRQETGVCVLQSLVNTHSGSTGVVSMEAYMQQIHAIAHQGANDGR
jgi:hypothetical protein